MAAWRPCGGRVIVTLTMRHYILHGNKLRKRQVQAGSPGLRGRRAIPQARSRLDLIKPGSARPAGLGGVLWAAVCQPVTTNVPSGTRQPSEANVPFKKTRGCFNMALSYGRSITLPQEIIDLILELTDQTTLKVCSRAASAFRFTSQRRLFSDILLMRSRDRPHLTIDGFSNILIRSPHLALHVRSLRIFEDSLFGPRPWIKSAKLASIISMFVNLTKLSIDSQTMLFWSSLPGAFLAALHIKLPTLTSLRFGNFFFDTSSLLVSLLQSGRSLQFLALSHVRVRIGMLEVDHDAAVLTLSSLEIDFSSGLMHSVLRVVDPQRLRYLRITAIYFEDVDLNTVQRLLDNAPNLIHLRLATVFPPPNTTDWEHYTESFRSHLHLRTLEFSVMEYWTSPMYDWIAGILSGVPNPSPVQHVILNVCANTRCDFIRYLSQLQPLLTAPPMAPLRRVTVRLDSYDGSHFGVGEEQKIRDALPALRDNGLLEVVLLEQN
ncbi:hypothetical protein GGX14DRAFT_654273 [Mycena pura]|uniref:F-box domain-containing protein n=1 Tax=Mycena pura TaxID=153505 RepID=A0AAD6V4V2_9AGAR|nr:hypothetical protein GGX14DRAFT_654273 [Mycena pura]